MMVAQHCEYLKSLTYILKKWLNSFKKERERIRQIKHLNLPDDNLQDECYNRSMVSARKNGGVACERVSDYILLHVSTH